MKATIDRIDEGITILISCDDETIRLNVPMSELPAGSREGDIITFGGGLDEAATVATRTRVGALIERLKRKGR